MDGVCGTWLVWVVFLNPCCDCCLYSAGGLNWVYLCNVCFLGLYVDKDEIGVISPDS